jgi:SAM-dependent methyltransferase
MPELAGLCASENERVTDQYADGSSAWWHLSRPSPELLEAVADGWLPAGGGVLDVGCGLGSEAGHLASLGWHAVGIDLSAVAVQRAAASQDGAAFLRADARTLPFRDRAFGAALDRGCFHYLPPEGRLRYAAELRRVLRPGGRLLLRASLHVAGERNDITEAVIRDAFRGWQTERLERAAVPSDTRLLQVIIARLVVPLHVVGRRGRAVGPP